MSVAPLLASGLAERRGHVRGRLPGRADLVCRDAGQARDLRDHRRARRDPPEQLGALDQRGDGIDGPLPTDGDSVSRNTCVDAAATGLTTP